MGRQILSRDHAPFPIFAHPTIVRANIFFYYNRYRDPDAGACSVPGERVNFAESSEARVGRPSYTHESRNGGSGSFSR